MSSDNHSNSPKKASLSSRKKLVDLKAVATLIEDSEHEPGHDSENAIAAYNPNEELIEQTSRIKDQRDLILKRMEKMQAKKEDVSNTVYEKVNRDYLMQLESINELLKEKKEILSKELKQLYKLFETQNLEVNRHKNILEEARFRNYLEEFSDEQYKEVEEFESQEIHNLQSELSKIQSLIQLHENLFDSEELGLSPAPKPNEANIPEPEPTRTIPPNTYNKTLQPQSSLPPSQPEPSTPEPEARGATQENIDSDYELSDDPDSDPLIESPDEIESVDTQNTESNPLASSASSDAIDLPDTTDQNYFKADDSISLTDNLKPQQASHNQENPTDQASAPTDNQGESVSDILKDLPLSEDVEPVDEKNSSEAEMATSNNISIEEADASPSYKLTITDNQGDTSLKEFALVDNLSIGRSPSNDIILKAPKVSRQHSAINKFKDKYLIIDLKSSNGVYVNGQKIDEHTLEAGDEISIGGYKMVFQKT